MLSTVTPIAEHTRGHRFAVTASWFVAGAIAGGATLGAGTALIATGVAVLDPSDAATLAVAAVVSALAAAHDASVFGVRLPAHTRQVNERWLDRYRGWVYGLGFGWQIGVGLATYITTAGVYLVVALGALSTSAAVALLVGITFGTVRGLAVLLGARITTPDRLFAFHRRFGALDAVSRRVMIGVECAALIVCAWVALGAPAAALAALGVGVVTLVAWRAAVPAGHAAERDGARTSLTT
jgi:hypothetical protein